MQQAWGGGGKADGLKQKKRSTFGISTPFVFCDNVLDNERFGARAISLHPHKRVARLLETALSRAMLVNARSHVEMYKTERFRVIL